MATGVGASLYVTGASTALSGGESFSLVSGNTYLIDTAAKEIFDPETALVINDGGSPISASGITAIDMLHGEVTLAAPPVGAVTIGSGAYLPRTQIALCTGVELTLAQTAPSDTPIGQAGRTRSRGLRDVTGSLMLTDPDAGTTVGGGDALIDLLRDGTSFVLDINRGSGSLWRARVKFDTKAGEVDRDALATTRLGFALDSIVSVEGYEVGFSRG